MKRLLALIFGYCLFSCAKHDEMTLKPAFCFLAFSLCTYLRAKASYENLCIIYDRWIKLVVLTIIKNSSDDQPPI
jgi:hypothetical protein